LTGFCSGVEGLFDFLVDQARVLSALGVGRGVAVIAPQLAQFLAVGVFDFFEQGFDGIVTLFDDAVAPAFGAVMELDRLLAGLVEFGQRGDNGVGVTRAQQLADELVVALERAALVVDEFGKRNGIG
jgi:hypothetical protein